MYNLNDAPPQQGDLIPNGTTARIIMTLRPGGVGPDGWLTQSKTSPSIMMDCEFTVMNGPYAKRKFWQYFVLEGSEQAVNISRQYLRAMIESSRGIKPDDYSENAVAIRNIPGLHVFDGLEFAGKIKIEKAKAGSGFDDKNKLAVVITPDMKDYQGVMDGTVVSPVPSNGTSAPSFGSNVNASPAATPAWGGNQKPKSNTTPAAIAPSPPKSNVPVWAMPATEQALPAENDVPF